MNVFFEADGAKLIGAEALEALAAMGDCSVDAVVTDPPYGLEFMGKNWDAPWKSDRRQTFDGTLSDDRDTPFSRSKVRNGNGASYGATSEVMRALQDWHYAWASECLRVLKPGGYLLAFGGARTYHRLACAVEDAGFEIRDHIMWVYGCLDEQTELVSESGVKPHHKAAVGERVLCYDPQNGEYSYQPILEIVEYDYSDTAYRLIGDFGEQVVSRNHRCIVEREGSEVFRLAETVGTEARVPVLESLSELQHALSDLQSNPGGAEQILQPSMRQCADRESEQYAGSVRATQRENGSLHSLRDREVDAAVSVEEGRKSNMQPRVQWSSQGGGMEATRPQREATVDAEIGICVEDSDDWRNQSGMEGRVDLSQAQRSLLRPKHQVRALSRAVHRDGAEGRLRDGTPPFGSASDWESAYAERVGSSQGSRCDEKQFEQPDAFCDERGAQGIRAWRGHKTTLVRVVPFHYTGKVWCLRVPTGAFVVYRNGVAFPTGNSGFPKSLDVSKTIDKAARGVPQGGSDSTSPNHGKYKGGCSEDNPSGRGFGAGPGQFMAEVGERIDRELVADAKQWEGWGTALKPAHEPIVVARKPLEGTVAANVLKWGTGAVNISGCRIGEGRDKTDGGCSGTSALHGGGITNRNSVDFTVGRWPANLIHDGSPEVLQCFPDAPGQLADPSPDAPSDRTKNCFGKMNREGEASAQKRYTEEGLTNFAALPGQRRFDSGSAARFFYCAKADSMDREEGMDGAIKNDHPTVKPVALMRYLCRLVTPPNGLIIDPFAGSGTTLVAARREGFRVIGIERDKHYCEIGKARMSQGVLLFGMEEE